MKHFLTLLDYSPHEIKNLILNAKKIKQEIHSPSAISWRGKTLAMLFSKKSTRTRISSETGWAYYGGHALFLGKDDIQWSAGEPIRDTAMVVSSMCDCILARMGPHQDILTLANYSKVPVINALTDQFHPLQALADLLTLYETFGNDFENLKKIKVTWVGDGNNVCHSLLASLPRLGIRMAIATPPGYSISKNMLQYAENLKNVEFYSDATSALHDTDVVVTDTWVSMGMEQEKQQRLKDFDGFQITHQLMENSCAKKDWKFMHCLPRKSQEVDDAVFYDEQRSLVWQEAENRKYTVMSVYQEMMKS